jgi:S-adenosyl methyltransferase
MAELVIEKYTAGTVHVHCREQTASYFAGLEIAEPGLTEARHWRSPQREADTVEESRTASLLAGVGRKVPRD